MGNNINLCNAPKEAKCPKCGEGIDCYFIVVYTDSIYGESVELFESDTKAREFKDYLLKELGIPSMIHEKKIYQRGE